MATSTGRSGAGRWRAAWRQRATRPSSDVAVGVPDRRVSNSLLLVIQPIHLESSLRRLDEFDLEIEGPAQRGDQRQTFDRFVEERAGGLVAIASRRRRANSRRPLTTSPPTAPSAYSNAATCGDASWNSTGRPIENWRRPAETRAAAGPGAITRREMVMAVMRERSPGVSREPGRGRYLDQRMRGATRQWRGVIR